MNVIRLRPSWFDASGQNGDYRLICSFPYRYDRAPFNPRALRHLGMFLNKFQYRLIGDDNEIHIGAPTSTDLKDDLYKIATALADVKVSPIRKYFLHPESKREIVCFFPRNTFEFAGKEVIIHFTAFFERCGFERDPMDDGFILTSQIPVFKTDIELIFETLAGINR